ncbi:MAG: hypothetical protein EP329_09780 [Deltaproteobacteria bacterium]|nr:MAG: hypothetical protein EP329_09780 [Deltaproteobacteria bacterium]
MKPALLILPALLALSALALAACPSAATPEQPEHAESVKPTYPGPPKPWHAMEMSEKGQYMKDVVLPTMKRIFQQHDPQNYADFGCDTCHGLDARERHFEMPNPGLYALYPPGSPQQQQMVAEKKATLAFMVNEVIPTMQQLLGEEPFDPMTKKGFGCAECHPHGVE